LRRRRRRRYVGPWLPSPIETDVEPPAYEIPGGEETTTEGRYELMESVSFAFLLALEALTPQQRAVLLLRDVFDYSVEETADALGLSAANVKTTHHRARRAMSDYDRNRSIPTRELGERTREMLERFLAGLFQQDVASVEKLLAEDVRFVSDGGGEFLAALHPVIGRAKVLRFYARGSSHPGAVEAVELRMLNGLPGVLVTFGKLRPRQAKFGVIRCEIDADGRITALHNVLASRKLSAIRF
jgi:RNA polymerase sigma-70 factor (ECF subfamily)